MEGNNFEQDKNGIVEADSFSIRQLPTDIRESQYDQDNGKDIDLRTINKEANKLARQFDKGNKQILEDIKKQEKEQKNQEREKQAEENEQDSQPCSRPIKLGFLGIMSVPFILIGALLLWINFIDATAINFVTSIVVFLAVAIYSYGTFLFFKGVFRALTTKERVLSIIFGVVLITASVLIVLYRAYVETYMLLGVGVIGVCIDFVYLFVLFVRAKKLRYVPYKAIVSFITFIAGGLIITTCFIPNVTILNIITGISAIIAGTLDFSV